jgi:hypothetical protein
MALRKDYIAYSVASYCEKWIGTFYGWGGDDPSAFDCSGLIHEALQAYGIEKRGYDSTAHQMYLNLKHNMIKTKPRPGCLVFWFRNGKAIHVEMVTEVIYDNVYVTGASGGGSKTKTREDAIHQNAYVKKNEINYRGTTYKVVDPFLVKDDV